MQLNNYEKKHIQKLRTYLHECCVLLRSKGDFPVKSLSHIALYGSGVRNTIKGGTGSGEVNSRYFDSVESAFEQAGIKVTTKKWLDAYDKIVAESFGRFKKDLKIKAKEMHTNVLMLCMGASMPAPEYNLSLEGEGDTALYILSRESGENTDRAVKKGEIFLSDTEIRDIRLLNKKYQHFMLVLNVGGVVDLSSLSEIDNILLLSQLGVETSHALVDIITGKANPSGKLATTWAAWSDYPKLIEFGGYDDTRYKEGIYVGYRYFDTERKEPLFPFGYGLSFTTFTLSNCKITNNKEEISVVVSVKNTGSCSGKEVVQTYVSLPSGRLDQPYQVLAGFAKTKELEPGEETQVKISFKLSDIASYDTKQASFVLEQGDYLVRVGNSSRNTNLVAVVTLKEDVVTKQVKNALESPDFKDYIPAQFKEFQPIKDFITRISLNTIDFNKEEVNYNKVYEIDEKVKKFSDEELLHIAMGYFDPKGGITGVVGNAGSLVAGSAGETAHIDGVKTLIMADGPAGIRIAQKYFVDNKGVHSMAPPMLESMMTFASGILKFIFNMSIPKPKKNDEVKYQYCTAIPIGTAIAQSWNIEFAEICGDIVGTEMEIFNIDLWLAPALNIHRSICCGRNFEYYSEDPVISGKMAAAITCGVQKHPNKGVTIKHFAANNQEFNRNSSNSMVSERAMREIYLKGFEICIKESTPKAVMSSYNLINGEHTSTRKDLMRDILRCEFGFDGILMTDWLIQGGTIPKDAKYKSPHPADIAAAGGDLYMPGAKEDYEHLVEGYKAGKVTKKQLQMNATRVVRYFK